MNEQRLKGIVNAPEFPPNTAWVNTDLPLLLSDFKGKIVLLDFWSSCCINCHHSLREIQALQAEFPENLVVLGIHSAKFEAERSLDHLQDTVLRHGIQHPVANDPLMHMWRQYAVRGWPTFVLINPAGRLVGQSSGEGIYERAKPVMKQLIELFGEMDMLNQSLPKWTPLLHQGPSKALHFPTKLYFDSITEKLYIADTSNHRIIISSRNGEVEHIIGGGTKGLVDGSYQTSCFNYPHGLYINENLLYIADTENHAIRVVDLEKKEVKTLVGNGKMGRKLSGTCSFNDLQLNSPWDIAVKDHRLFVAMAGVHQVWDINLNKQNVSVLAGNGAENIVDGIGEEAVMAQPSALCLIEDTLFVADSESSSIRRINLQNKEVKTLIGEGLFVYGNQAGSLSQAKLQHPLDLSTDGTNLYVADSYNDCIKMVDFQNNIVETLTDAEFKQPAGLSHVQGRLFVAETNHHQIKTIDLQTAEAALFDLQLSERSALLKSQIEAKTEQQVMHPEGVLSIRIGESFDEYRVDERSRIVIKSPTHAEPIKDEHFNSERKIEVALSVLGAAPSILIEASILYCPTQQNDQACYIHEEKLHLHLSAENPLKAHKWTLMRQEVPSNYSDLLDL